MDSCGIFQYTEYGMSIPKEPLKCIRKHCMSNQDKLLLYTCKHDRKDFIQIQSYSFTSVELISYHMYKKVVFVVATAGVELLQFDLKSKSKTVIFQVLGTICAPNFRVFNAKINQVLLL